MSKEYMLRVTPPSQWVGENVQVLFFENGEWIKGVWIKRSEMELTPPKDWTPYCYNDDGVPGGCGWIRGPNSSCQQCLYRKRD